MIKLLFEKGGQYFFITIDNRKILYWDKLQGKLWGGPLQYLPPDPSVMRKIDLSRNKIPAHFKHLLEVKEEDLKEFENAKDDEELKQIVLKDCKATGCKLITEKKE